MPLRALRPVLEFEAQRAREFYRSAEELLPLIDDDSQPALWTMVEIYRGCWNALQRGIMTCSPSACT